MHNLKFGVLACGLVGLVGCFLPLVEERGTFSWFDGRTQNAATTYLVMAGYAVALVAAALGALRGMERWLSAIAIIGFAFVIFKFRFGLSQDGTPFELFALPLGGKLMGAGMFAGLAFAIASVVKPEPPR